MEKDQSKHEVEVLLLDEEMGFVYHCIRCGKCMNHERGAWALMREDCSGEGK